VGATGLGGLWALERAWHAAETNLRLVLIVSEISAFIRTNRRTWLDRLGDPSDPSGSETLPSACYLLSDESSIPFYSTSNGYNDNY